MKRTALIISIVVGFTLGAFGQKAVAAKVDPAKGVRDAFDKLVEGIEQVDAAKVMSVYEKGDRILFFNNKFPFQTLRRKPVRRKGDRMARWARS